jgi:hypothetical protein
VSIILYFSCQSTTWASLVNSCHAEINKGFLHCLTLLFCACFAALASVLSSYYHHPNFLILSYEVSSFMSSIPTYDYQNKFVETFGLMCFILKLYPVR